jgi:flagellar biosynthesis protein FlhG
MPEARHDQASGLRRLFAPDPLQVLAVRGSGAQSATAVTIDLATALVAMGRQPLVVDLDQGRAALGLGLKARYELAHLLRGDKTLPEVLLVAANGVAVLPATRGLPRAAGPASVDAGSPLLVVAPTRAAITEAYAQIKVLARDHGQREFRVVVDRAASESAALSVYSSIAETARRFLAARLDYCGYLPDDSTPGRTRHPPAPRAADVRSPRGHACSRLAEAVFAALPAQPPHSAFNPG